VTSHAASRVVLALLISVAAAACGKKGPPLPPLRPVPTAIPDLAAELDGGRVTLTFTIPSTNTDGTTPPVIERVEIYALTGPAPMPPPATPRGGPPAATPPATPPGVTPPVTTTPPPPVTPPPAKPATPQAGAPAAARPPATDIGVSDLVTDANRLATIRVQPAPPPPVAMPGAVSGAPAPAPAGTGARTGAGAEERRQAPGEVATYVDVLVPPAAAGGPPLARYYAVVGFAGRRRGPLSAMAVVPLGRVPAAPTAVSLEYDETTLKITWESAAPRQAFNVFEVAPEAAPGLPPATPTRLTAKPVTATEFATAVTFGGERCFVVRSVEIAGRATVAGEAAAPACVTAVDRFPPPAPANLAAVAVEGAIELDWSGVEASDLAGYLVLRGEGASGTLQRLTQEPVTATQYRDQSVRPGVTYVYSVVAVDKATPSNQSAQSNRQQVTARAPEPGATGKDVR